MSDMMFVGGWVEKKVRRVAGLYIHNAELTNPVRPDDPALTLTLGTKDKPTQKLIIRDISESGYNGEQYLHTDDDLESFVGAKFKALEARKVTEREPEHRTQEHYYHDVGFLYVQTSLGPIILETHKLQNGYYSGFVIGVVVKEV